MRYKRQQLAGAPDLFMTVLVQDLMSCSSFEQDFGSHGKAQNANLKCNIPQEYP